MSNNKNNEGCLSTIISLYISIGLIYGIYFFFFVSYGNLSNRLAASLVRSIFWVLYLLIHFFPETIRSIGALVFGGIILFLSIKNK